MTDTETTVTTPQLQSTIKQIIDAGDPTSLTSKQIRTQAEQSLHLPPNALIQRKEEINSIIEQLLKQQSTQQIQNNHTPTPQQQLSQQSTQSTNNTNKRPKLDTDTKPSTDNTVGDNAPNEDFYIDLGKNKRVTVGQYKGKLLINIREYYEQNGILKPGSKGIALTDEQFNRLYDNIEKVKYAIDNVK